MANDYPVTYDKIKDARSERKQVLLEHAETAIVVNGSGNLALSRINLATGLDFEVIGTPVVTASYMRGKGATNYIKTDIVEKNDWTLLFVAKAPDAGTSNATRGTVIGNFVGSADYGFLVYFPSATQIRAQIEQAPNDPKIALLTVPNIDQFKRYSIICDSSIGANGRLTLKNETDNTVSTVDLTAARSPGAGLVNVLSSNSASFTGNIDINHLRFINGKALDDPELLAEWQRFEPWSIADGAGETIG